MKKQEARQPKCDGLKAELAMLKKGGKLYLPVGTYDIDETILMDTPCIKMEGEVWNYSSDPNGVFESEYGTKLRMRNNDIPAIIMSKDHVLGGNIIKDIGIQGNIVGMDTRGLFRYDNPRASAGIYFDHQRIDQAEFSKISFCGLASAICASGNAEIDACTFEKLNTDGCCIGIYFAPNASYYTMFRNCIVADTPCYGFFVNGQGRNIHHLEIRDMKFVRNGGAFAKDDPYPKAAVCLYQVSDCSIRNCTFDCAGTFWYYAADAKHNDERQPYTQATPALWIEGNKNHIIGNTFSNCMADAIIIHGDDNIIMNNIIDRNVIIKGKRNIISGNIFTNKDAKILLDDAEDTRFIQVEEERIQRIK